jgi:hypothetical protein
MPKISENLERLKSICIKAWFIAIEKEWKFKFMKLIIKNAFVFFAFPIVLISLSMPVFSACSGSPPQNMGILQPGIDFCWNNPAVCGLACPPITDCTATESALARCNTDLSTANGNLTSCNTEKGTLNTNLTSCNTEKGTLNVNLTQCYVERDKCRIDLAMANTPSPCVCPPTTPCPEKVQLAQCNTEKGTLNANLTNCNTNLVQCNAEKAQCQTDKNNCNTNLTQSNAEKAQCLTDKNVCNTNLTNCNTEKAQCLTDKNICNTNLTNCNTEKATLNTNWTNCNTEKGTLSTNLTNCNTEKATLSTNWTTCNTDCNTEKGTLETNLTTCNTEKDTLKNTLTNTSCGSLEVPEPAQQNKHSYFANTKLHIPAVEVDLKIGNNRIYEVDMCLNNVGSLMTFTLIPQSLKEITTVK